VGQSILLEYNGSAASVSVPAEVKYLSSAFTGTAVTQVILPDSLQGICKNPFEDSSVNSVIYQGTNREIQEILGRQNRLAVA
jgi:hypothetical protein